MEKRLVWSEQALKDAARLDARMRVRVVAAVERLAEAGYGDVKRLRGRDNEGRLRVGDGRVLLAEESEPETLTV